MTQLDHTTRTRQLEIEITHSSIDNEKLYQCRKQH